jgi:hypothetical protein
VDKVLGSFAPYAYAILRIVAGLLFVCHGGQKIFGWFGGQPVPLGSLFGGRYDRNNLRPAYHDRAVQQLCGIHRQRRNGRRIFHGPFSEKFLAARKRRRAGGPILLHLFVYGDSRLGNLECRCSSAPVMKIKDLFPQTGDVFRNFWGLRAK